MTIRYVGEPPEPDPRESLICRLYRVAYKSTDPDNHFRPCVAVPPPCKVGDEIRVSCGEAGGYHRDYFRVRIEKVRSGEVMDGWGYGQPIPGSDFDPKKERLNDAART